MAVVDFLDKNVVVKRAVTVSGFRKTLTATVTVPVHIQQASDEKTSLVQGVFGRTYVAWTSLNTNIEEGDRLIDPDGREFEVKTINHRDYGINVHLEIVMERLDNLANE